MSLPSHSSSSVSAALSSSSAVALSEQSQDLFFTFKAAGLPDADLVVTQFSVEEKMSDLYSITVHLASRRPDHDLAKLIDKGAVLIVHDRYQAEPRYFHGLVAEAVKGNSGHAFTNYTVTLMPRLHHLRYGSDCRIFQSQNVLDIVKTLLSEHGIEDWESHLREEHPSREYLTQYHESHLRFFERILAEEGMSYYFRHEKDKHILVLTDATIHAPDVDIDDQLEYNATAGGAVRHHYINDFVWREQVMVSEVSQRDHYFKKPHHSYQTSHSAEDAGLSRDLSIYAYPGRYKADKVGQDFSRYWLESWRKDAATGTGGGRCQYLTVGHCFRLREHEDGAMNRRYFLTDVRHFGQQSGSLEEYAGEGATFVSTSFHCIRADVAWRADRQVRPKVDGPQMAMVVGPEGEEIYCDEYGRVKVSFPWDRYSVHDERSSCWIRVASNWAGGLWGHIAIPRIGQHVIVDYLEGDPDQPIIVGRAYNSVNQPPYSLPEHKTRMVIKSKTHKGNGFNELRFEDEKDREEVFIHAQKDMNIVVLHDRDKDVGNDQTERVGHDKTIEVGHIHKEMIGKDMHLNVAEMKETHVGKVENSHVGEFKNITVGKQLVIRVGASKLVMKEDGTILLSGVNFNFTATESVQINGKVVDLN